MLDAACELFVREGASTVSLRKVASALGVTPMALYRHVDNKEDLLARVLHRGYQEFHAYLSRDAGGRRGLARLRAASAGFGAFALERASYFDLMFLGRSLPNDLGGEDSVREVALPTFKLLRDCVHEAIDMGELEGAEPQSTAVTLLAQATGVIALHRTGLFAWTDDEARVQLEAAVEHVLRGFSGPPQNGTAVSSTASDPS
ncbi:MAG: TetR/AcrR family transcriptional regulator [Myxococcota bacterium]